MSVACARERIGMAPSGGGMPLVREGYIYICMLYYVYVIICVCNMKEEAFLSKPFHLVIDPHVCALSCRFEIAAALGRFRALQATSKITAT